MSFQTKIKNFHAVRLSVLADGTYKVTLTNECGTFKTRTIDIQPSPNAPLQISMSGMDPMCAGDGSGGKAG